MRMMVVVDEDELSSRRLSELWVGLQASSISRLKDLQATAIDSILITWFAFQNHSVLAAEALVETVVALYRSGWSVERVQMELSFLTLQRQRAGMDQVQSIDSEMLLSFVLLIMITAKVGKPLSLPSCLER